MFDLKKIEPEMKSYMDDSGTLYKALSLLTPYADTTPNAASPALSCALLRPENGTINIAALNGHQFCLFSEESGLSDILSDELLLDFKNTGSIMSFLGAAKELKIAIDEKRIFFRREEAGVVTMFSTLRTIEQFPNYENFVGSVENAENPVTLTVNRSEVLEALARLSIFNTDNVRNVLFEKAGDDGITMSAPGTASGNGVEPLEATIEGDDLRVSFPTKGLTDVLNTFSSELVTLTVTGAEKPCSVTGCGDEDKGVYSIIMPMMLQEEIPSSEVDQAA